MRIDTEALTEVDVILGLMPKEDFIKIPNGLKKFIKTRKSQSYIPNIEKNIPLYKQNLKQDTKTLCSLIYRSYLCSKEEKISLEQKDKEILIQNEKELIEKYNPDNIFKNKKTTVVENIKEQHTEMIEYKERKWYKKIFDKIFKIFKR